MVVNRSLPAPAGYRRVYRRLTSFFGAWLSYYLDGATGGIIVVAQTLLFLITFIFAPKHGLLASRRRAREAAC